MQRYFLPDTQDCYQTEDILIHGEQFHHMSRVMRMKEGDVSYLVLTDRSLAFKAKITDMQTDHLKMRWIEDETDQKELPVSVTIASGLPKGDKLEMIVQKGTELGAAAFMPFSADYSITKWKGDKAAKKRNRLQKIAQEAAEQSHRTSIPEIEKIHAFSELILRVKHYDLCLVAYEENAKNGEVSHFAESLSLLKPGAELLIIFGPEGGLSEKEAEALTNEGARTCSLGPRILRTETAPLYALAAVSYVFELA